MVTAIGTPSMPQRVDSDRSATITTLDVLGCSNSRMISGLKLVSDDCGQSMDLEAIAGLPFAQARRNRSRTRESGWRARRS